MCLKELSAYPVLTDIGYKILRKRKFDTGPINYVSPIYEYSFFQNKWNIDESDFELDASEDEPIYTPGFHIYYPLNMDEIFALNNELKDKYYSLIQVKFKNVVATGYEYVSKNKKIRTIVAKELYILKEIHSPEDL